MKNKIEKITSTNNNYDDGGCGDFARTMLEIDTTAKALGVVAYDGDFVHVFLSSEYGTYDGSGFKTIDEIKEEWAFDRSADEVQIVKIALQNDTWIYNGQELSANIINLED